MAWPTVTDGVTVARKSFFEAVFAQVEAEVAGETARAKVAEKALEPTLPSQNTRVGEKALESLTTGKRNVATGTLALQSTTEGSENTAQGHEALRLNTTGSENTAQGALALLHNSTGNRNTAGGNLAMQNNTEGSENATWGYAAGFGLTTGNKNVFAGSNAGQGVKTGSSNVCIGFQAGRGLAAGASNRLLIANNETSPLISGTLSGIQALTLFSGAEAHARIPFLVIPQVEGPAAIADPEESDVVGISMQPTFKKSFTGIKGADPGDAFGMNLFTRVGTGTVAEDTAGLTSITGLANEIAVMNTSEAEITSVEAGVFVVNLWGKNANAHIGTAVGLRCQNPRKMEEAKGSIGTIYNLFVEEAKGAATNYSLYVQGGTTFFDGVGSKIGFFGRAPVAIQKPGPGEAELRTALKNLGLIE